MEKVERTVMGRIKEKRKKKKEKEEWEQDGHWEAGANKKGER
jgi:hypothetical protein